MASPTCTSAVAATRDPAPEPAIWTISPSIRDHPLVFVGGEPAGALDLDRHGGTSPELRSQVSDERGNPLGHGEAGRDHPVTGHALRGIVEREAWSAVERAPHA